MEKYNQPQEQARGEEALLVVKVKEILCEYRAVLLKRPNDESEKIQEVDKYLHELESLMLLQEIAENKMSKAEKSLFKAKMLTIGNFVKNFIEIFS